MLSPFSAHHKQASQINAVMAFEDGSKKELQKVGLEISNRFPLTRTTLASMESLSLPVVQEVVLSADMQCEKCQKRVADFIAKMNETESVVVNVLEKKVVLTFRLTTIGKVISQQIIPFPKVAIIKRIFRFFTELSIAHKRST